VENAKKEDKHWAMCPDCQGRGRRSRRLSKKVRRNFQRELDAFEKNNSAGTTPVRPKGHLDACLCCNGSGLVAATNFPEVDTENYPHVAIIGGGIGGIALAVACLHRGIPFTIYERDRGFDVRSQGYGLTLQQASKAIEGLGVFELEGGVISTRHVVHTTEGKVLGEWGMRKWGRSDAKAASRRTNIHIARQSLRAALLEQLGGHDAVQWGHQLIDFKQAESEDGAKSVDLRFQVEGEMKCAQTDLVMGADGIRSSVRNLLIGEEGTSARTYHAPPDTRRTTRVPTGRRAPRDSISTGIRFVPPLPGRP
jgi:salicylate hydroxylase